LDHHLHTAWMQIQSEPLWLLFMAIKSIIFESTIHTGKHI
jgi:hypothetical protein